MQASASDADYVGRLEALGALQQVKLHRFALVERAIAVFLNSGKMHKYVFSGGALDKAISFRPVKPLDCPLLSHKNSFRLVKYSSAAFAEVRKANNPLKGAEVQQAVSRASQCRKSKKGS